MTALAWTWFVTLASAAMMLWGYSIVERGSRIGYGVLGLAAAGVVCGSISLWARTGIFG